MTDVVKEMLEKRNKGTEDCVLTTQIAKCVGMSAPDLNSFLIDLGVLKRTKCGSLKIASEYSEMGLTKQRVAFRFTARGTFVEDQFPVWTEEGVRFLENKLKVKLNIKQNSINN